MDDVNDDPVQGVLGGEDGTLGPDISDEALNCYLEEYNEKDEYLLLPNSPSFIQDLDDPGELAGPQEPPQPDHPPPRAPEVPHSQGKFEKRCLISKVDEKAVAGVDGIVSEMDEEVPTCDGVPKGKAEVPCSAKNINLTALDGDKGVPSWTSFPKTSGNMDDSQAGGVPMSATSYPAYSGGSLPETGVPSSASMPMSAGIEREVPAITSANPSTEPQGARSGSQAISYITSSAVNEVYSTSAPQMSSGTQASSASNTVPGNGRTILLKFCGTNIALPISMRHLVIQSGTDDGTTGGGGGVPPNPMAGTPLTSNQPSTSKIDFERNTWRKIKEEKKDEEEEEEEEEEEGERESAGVKRQIGKTQKESKRRKRRRQNKKQTEEEEEEEEEKLPPRYLQAASDDPVEERKRKDAIRAWKVRERKKNRLAELQNENERLKEEIEERDRLQKEKEEKYQEEIDQLRREKEELTAQVEGWRTWVAGLLTTLRERFNIFVASQGPS